MRQILSVLLILIISSTSNGQDSLLRRDSFPPKKVSEIIPDRNFIKLNLLALPLKNISIQYEYALSKRFSLALGFRFMPNGNLPMLSALEQNIDNDNTDFLNTIRSTRVNNIAVTPEVRWYPGKKGYGRGFYLALYYRYVQMGIASSKPIEWKIDDEKRNMRGNVNIKLHNIGLMMGGQWMLSKRIFLDWWIMGAQAGFQTGEISLVPDQAFSDQQISTLKNDIKVNFTKLGQTTEINNQKVSIKTNSFLELTGLRTGLCLGVRF